MRFTKQQSDMVIMVLIIAIVIALLSTMNKKDNSPDADYYYQSGRDLMDEFNYDAALPFFNEALRLDPNHTETLSYRCNILNRFGRSEDALVDCNKAIELDRFLIHAYANRCLVYQSLDRFEEALADCDYAIKQEPNNATWVNYRGLLYSHEGEEELAISDFNRALELEPDDAVVLYNRGRSYYDLEELDEAIADFERTIEINGGLWFAYAALSYSYYDDGNIEAAFTTADAMIEHLPYHPESYHNRGLLYDWEAKFAEAEADYLRAIELDEDFSDAYYDLSYLYLYNGDNENALQYLCEYQKREGDGATFASIVLLGGCPEAEATPEATQE